MQLSSINSISNRHSGRLKSSRRRCCRSMPAGPRTSNSSRSKFQLPLLFGENQWRCREFRCRPSFFLLFLLFLPAQSLMTLTPMTLRRCRRMSSTENWRNIAIAIFLIMIIRFALLEVTTK